MRATVVICAYDPARWEVLCQAIHATLAQQPPPHEIIVVIDHHDRLLTRAQRSLASVRVVPNTGSRGLSDARNSGVAAATGEVVVFLDDDAVPRPGWLAALLEPFGNADVVGVGGAVEPAWQSRRPAWFPEEFLWVVGCSYRGLPEHPSPVRNPIGASMAYRRDLLTEVGGFRSGLGRVGRIPLGCEETELAIRASQRRPGAVHWYQPASVVHHCVAEDRVTWRYFRRRCFAEGLSKASVARLAGSRDGLASERGYVRRTLPTAVARNLALAARRREAAAAARAAAIVAGLMITASGYVVGAARR